MMKTKKIINDGDDAVDEMLDGFIAAQGDLVERPEGSSRSIISRHGPQNRQSRSSDWGRFWVTNPRFWDLWRRSGRRCSYRQYLCFAATSTVIDCAKAIDGGKGVLFIYGNYAGDVMNFDMAAEMLEMDGIEARTVLTTDDIASAPIDERENRRGVAGNFFIFKAAGAACAMMHTLDEVERIARKANERTYTMGVATSACSLPQTRKPNFEMGPDEMGNWNGYPRGARSATRKLRSADEIADEIMDAILGEMNSVAGDKVCVLVNSLGATPMMELYILNRRASQRLACAGLIIHQTWVGPYCTSMEMAGASISIMHMDEELIPLIDHQCRCLSFENGFAS